PLMEGRPGKNTFFFDFPSVLVLIPRAMSREKVILRRVDRYDPAAVAGVVREGIEELGLAPRLKGRVTIKPNVVFAHHKLAPAAYTRAEFLEGLVTALKDKASGGMDITVAERCGSAIPTTRMFRRAGYYRLKKKLGFKLEAIEEAKKVKVALSRGTLHHQIRTARSIVERDFLVYAPKLKTNVLVLGPTTALKLNIGLLLDRERMWNHNERLDEKIVDLLEVGTPDFIATDGVETCIGGNQLTGEGKHLGAVILAAHPLAHDVVCSHIFNLDPAGVGYLKLAAERGYGSLRLGDIDLQGDIALDELQRRTRGWNYWFLRADELPGNIKALCGEPYCRGGCHGVFLDWIYMIKDRKPRLWNNLPEWTVVAGKYKGDVSAKRVWLLGTCTEVEGKISARRKIRIRGCPPKHKTLVLWMFLKAGILNPMFRLDLVFDGYVFLFFSWLRRLVRGRL
ncbi:MAG: DUF362 domain-containing protein, partial [Candidatus Aminicenantes bacterium]|nr:DUF362 domain-containing protein [Candidatus Aminicenantes bacterium]